MERLEDRADKATGLAPPFELAAAVAAQLQRIVACRPNMGAPGMPVGDFGLPAVVELGVGQRDLDAYGARLLKAIARHEPRLRAVRREWASTGRVQGPRKLVVHGCLVGEGEDARAFRFEMPTTEARA
jgi:predicted component of type VI protein secretion system